MKIIVAADKNWGIGKDNKLLVSIPADMKMFRQETTGKVCVMGRKTLESFPGGLPLKNRINIVLTRNENYKVKDAFLPLLQSGFSSRRHRFCRLSVSGDISKNEAKKRSLTTSSSPAYSFKKKRYRSFAAI